MAPVSWCIYRYRPVAKNGLVQVRGVPRMRRLFQAIMLVVGLGLFAWYLAGLDLPELRETLSRIGFAAPLVLVPYLVVYAVDCLAWGRTLPKRVPFGRLFRIRWAGESVNNTIPSAYIGGEAVKVWLLRSSGISGREGATSAVVSKTAQTISQVLFILLASAVFLVLAQDQAGLRAGLLVIVAGAVGAVIALCWIQKMGVVRVALALARFIPRASGWIEERKQKLLEFDETIFHFYRHERARFYQSVGLYFAGWLLDTLEVFLVAYLLGLPITWSQALVIEAFAGVAKVAGMWVPGSLGVQESGIVVLARLVAAPSGLGVAYALIRRARDLVFAAVGWWFLLRETSLREIRAEAVKIT
jgi:uncharacterized protein (TIRG00374 family)